MAFHGAVAVDTEHYAAVVKVGECAHRLQETLVFFSFDLGSPFCGILR